MNKKNSHLRIVWDKEAQHLNLARRKPTQFSFPFSTQEGALVTFIVESAMSGSLLSKTLSSVRPHYLLDFRTCPRFDLFGYTRQKAFVEFEHYGAKYLCLSTEEATTTISERIQTLIGKLGKRPKSIDGPLLVFVEDEEIVAQVSHALPKPRTKNGKWSITVEKATA